MRLFACPRCGWQLYFENTRCQNCGADLGFEPETLRLEAIEAPAPGSNRPADGAARRLCANARHDACNWLAAAGAPEGLCACCALNRTIPDLSRTENLVRWRAIEAAKRRLVYALRRFGPAMAPAAGPVPLAFDILEAREAPVTIGHADGLVTLDIAEAEDARREAVRAAMDEPYRTLLGHLRHETGHWCWTRLTATAAARALARDTFGDETQDYPAALARHYAMGPPPDWRERFVSAYASAHPAEDFAETWAHYLHIVDTVDTAASFGLALSPPDPALEAEIRFDPYAIRDADRLLDAWTPLTVAVNSLNRSMGLADLYPFVLSPAARTKLSVMHRLVRAATGGGEA